MDMEPRAGWVGEDYTEPRAGWVGEDGPGAQSGLGG